MVLLAAAIGSVWWARKDSTQRLADASMPGPAGCTAHDPGDGLADGLADVSADSLRREAASRPPSTDAYGPRTPDAEEPCERSSATRTWLAVAYAGTSSPFASRLFASMPFAPMPFAPRLFAPTLSAPHRLAATHAVASDGDVPREASQPVASARLEVLDVGQGTAMLLIDASGHAILIDVGPASGGEAVLDALARAGVSRVRLAVLSHFDSDHVGGLWRVWAGTDGIDDTQDDLVIDAFWDRGPWPSPTAQVAQEYLLAPVNRRAAQLGDEVHGDEVELKVVSSPSDPSHADENARGIALCGRVGRRRILYLADLPEELGFQAASRCGEVDVLIAAHHGAAEDNSSRILAASAPKLVLISAGMRNAYCHPSAHALATFSTHSVWMTGAAGIDGREACPLLVDAPWASEMDVDRLDLPRDELPSSPPRHVLVGGDLVIPG